MRSRALSLALLLLVACAPAAPPGPPATRPTATAVPPTVAQPTAAPVDPNRTLFGIAEGIRNDRAFADSGANWQRVVLSWSAAQPSGPNEFREVLPRAVIDAQVRRGVRIAGLVQFTPRWAQTDERQGERSPPRGLELPFDDAQNHFGRFMFETAKRYAGTIDEWIIWNEPEFMPGEPGVGESYTWLGTEQQYARLLNVGYQAVKAANPNALVSFAGTSYWTDVNANRPLYYERVLALDRSVRHDAVALNLYRSPDDVHRVHGVFKAIQKKHGIDVPVWLTETNAMPTDDRQLACSHADDAIKTTMQQQAAFAVQTFALAAASGYKRIGFYQMVDADACRQPGVWGATRDDGSRRPVFDALRAAITTLAPVKDARFVPLARMDQAWPAWPDDPTSFTPNWGLYQVVLDMADGRRVSVLWNGDGSAACVGVRQSGRNARLFDKYGALQLEPTERDGWRWLVVPPATAHAAGDPDGYFFIGGDPLLLVEDGVPPTAPVVEPTTGCSFSNGALTLERGFLLSVTPSNGQTVRRGETAEFQVRTRGLAGFDTPLALRVVEWSTQQQPTPRAPSSLPLNIALPPSIAPGKSAAIRLETIGAGAGIYYVALEASAAGMSKRLDLALVVD